jgi:hypothetical protein
MTKSWPCDPNCSLCYCIPETGDHLLTECNFSEAVWDRVTQDLLLHPALIPFQKGSISEWITTLNRAGSKEQQREVAGIMYFFWWCIWKEQNQRIFKHKECSSGAGGRED